MLTLVTVLFLAVACSRNVSKTDEAIDSTTITWIEDKPGPSLQPLKLYPTVPDSLWKALGLQEGVPSSMSCFLLQTEGKNILLDAVLSGNEIRLDTEPNLLSDIVCNMTSRITDDSFAPRHL